MPITRAVLPRISSSTSGLTFCGMIDEPVQNACGSLRKSNSPVDQRIHSSAQVLRCSAISASAKANSSDEVAVARDVEAVGRHAVEAQPPGHVVAVDRQARAGHGRRAQRQHVGPPAAIGQPLPVALELLAVGQPVVRRPAPAGPAAGACSRAGCTSASRVAAADERPLQGRPAARRSGRSRRGPTAAGRWRPGRCGCGRCAACGRRRRAGRSAPARCACGCLPARCGTGSGPAQFPGGSRPEPCSICWHSSAVIRPTLASIWAWAIEPAMSCA